MLATCPLWKTLAITFGLGVLQGAALQIGQLAVQVFYVTFCIKKPVPVIAPPVQPQSHPHQA